MGLKRLKCLGLQTIKSKDLCDHKIVINESDSWNIESSSYSHYFRAGAHLPICPNSDKFNSNPSTVQECSSWSHLPQIVTFLWFQTDICGSGGEHIYTHIIAICFLDYLNRHRFCVENLLCCALILYWNSFIFISFFNDDIILL